MSGWHQSAPRTALAMLPTPDWSGRNSPGNAAESNVIGEELAHSGRCVGDRVRPDETAHFVGQVALDHPGIFAGSI